MMVGSAAAACAQPVPPAAIGHHAAPGPLPAANVRIVTVAPYGEITIDDGAIVLMDHGNGDQRVHVMTISRDYHGAKLSWDDLAGPRSDVRRGTFPIDSDERAYIQSWAQRLWQLAPEGRRSFPRPPGSGTPPFEWAIVMRRGDEVRIVDGGAEPEEDSEPVEEMTDFLDMHF